MERLLKIDLLKAKKQTSVKSQEAVSHRPCSLTIPNLNWKLTIKKIKTSWAKDEIIMKITNAENGIKSKTCISKLVGYGQKRT